MYKVLSINANKIAKFFGKTCYFMSAFLTVHKKERWVF